MSNLRKKLFYRIKKFLNSRKRFFFKRKRIIDFSKSNFDSILNSPAFIIYLENEKTIERKNFAFKNVCDAGFRNVSIFDAVNGNNPLAREEMNTFFPNIKIDNEPNGGQRGCLFSHLKLLKHIIDNNISTSTIFEDDVYFHPKWKELAPKYFFNTPKNFDVLFIGNQIDNPEKFPKINISSCFCTHAYVVTLEGAKKLLHSLLNWDYENFCFFQPGWNLTGLYNIDIMIKNIQMRTNNKTINSQFIWYCWNGIYHVCEDNTLSGFKIRNTGLVFQSSDFKYTIFNYPY